MTTNQAWKSQYLTLIEDCEARESRLSDWERGFIDSIKKQIEEGRHPSIKQIDTLDNIWEKVTAKG